MSQSLPKRSLHQVIIMFRFLVAPGILTVNFNCKYSSYYTRELLECLLGFRLLGKIPAGPKYQNRSIYKVQNQGNERRYIYRDPRQDSGQRNMSYTRYPKKCFTQTYRDLHGDAMLVLTWMSSNMADGNQQKHLLPSFVTKAWIYSHKKFSFKLINIKVILFLIRELFR